MDKENFIDSFDEERILADDTIVDMSILSYLDVRYLCVLVKDYDGYLRVTNYRLSDDVKSSYTVTKEGL